MPTLLPVPFFSAHLFRCKCFPKIIRGAECGSLWIKAVIKWKYVYCTDLFALSFRHNGYSSPETLFGRAEVLSPPDPTRLAERGGCSAGGRCTSVSAKGIRWYLQQVWCFHMGVGSLACSSRKQCCDKVAAVKGHCIGKQWKFRKGIKKDQMHINKSLLDLGLSKLSIMKWLQLVRGCLLLIFYSVADSHNLHYCFCCSYPLFLLAHVLNGRLS